MVPAFDEALQVRFLTRALTNELGRNGLRAVSRWMMAASGALFKAHPKENNLSSKWYEFRKGYIYLL